MANLRDVVAVLRADDKKLSPELRRARKKFKKFNRGVSRDMKKSFQKVRRTVGTVVGTGLVTGLALAGREAFRFEKKLLQLSLQANKGKAEMGRFSKKLSDVSRETGVNRDVLTNAAEAYVTATGDFEGAADSLQLFADISQATGTSAEDMARTLAVIKQNFKEIRPDQIREAFGVLTIAGKSGSVVLKDMAAQLGPMSGLFQKFGSSGVDGLKDLAASYEVIQSSFGFSAEKARTGMNSLFSALIKNTDKFKKATGVDVKGKTLFEILDELETKDVKDISKLLEGMGEVKGARAMEALLKNYEKAKEIKADFDKNGASSSVVGADADIYRDSNVGKMEKSMNAIKLAFIEIFTPERIEKFANAADNLAPILEIIANNIGKILLLWAGSKGIGTVKNVGMFAKHLSTVGSLAPTAANATGSLVGKMGGVAGKLGLIGAAFSAGWIVGEILNAVGATDLLVDSMQKLLGTTDEDMGIGADSEALAISAKNQLMSGKGQGRGALQDLERGGYLQAGQTTLTDAQRAKFSEIAKYDRDFDGVDLGPKVEQALRARSQSNARAAQATADATFANNGVIGPALSMDPKELLVSVVVDKEGLLNAKVRQDREKRRGRGR